MGYTIKYSIIALIWFSLFPVLLISIVGDSPNPNVMENTIIWIGGLSFFFYLWARNDQNVYGDPKNSIIWFSLGWFILPILIVIPYLFLSRGKKLGIRATFKYLLLCLSIFIGTGIILNIVNYINRYV
ncbi:hypothetical protein N9060_00985 [Arenicella sp.]|nr:hypothetical protein [Arenicella sp.]